MQPDDTAVQTLPAHVKRRFGRDVLKSGATAALENLTALGWRYEPTGWVKIDKRLVVSPAQAADLALSAASLNLSLTTERLRVAKRSEQPLYVFRPLENGKELVTWAVMEGLINTVDATDMHVTVIYSKAPVDWIAMGQSYTQKLIIEKGGPRTLERFGDDGTVVALAFASDDLHWRNHQMREHGASSDFTDYTPHVTLAIDVPVDRDISQIVPYQGRLIFGPETFQAIDEDWKDRVRSRVAKIAGAAGAVGRYNPHDAKRASNAR